MTMGASLHVSLPDDMRRFVDRLTDGTSLYATPSEYVRDLIRKDMQKMEVYQSLLQGLDQAERGEFVPDGFMDELIEDLKTRQI
jgi:antitoxin ParD1/3/4